MLPPRGACASRIAELKLVIRESTLIRGVQHADIEIHGDSRGWFAETFRRTWFPHRDWDEVQINLATSRAGVLRGLHYHFRQIDYWCLVSGRVRVGLYDLRPGSPTLGARESVVLDAATPAGLFIPVGVAHGYLALTDIAISYVVDRYFDGSDEYGVAWDDPDIAIPWGIDKPTLSARDAANPRLQGIPVATRPAYPSR
jgi:dTDP-4-dehydrorhamnose 3,5-epimerase